MNVAVIVFAVRLEVGMLDAETAVDASKAALQAQIVAVTSHATMDGANELHMLLQGTMNKLSFCFVIEFAPSTLPSKNILLHALALLSSKKTGLLPIHP